MLKAPGVLLLLLAGPALAEDWQVLRGEALRAALAARVLAYPDGSVQNFFRDGRTLLERDGPAWGLWRVEGDSCCVQWPPSGRWHCHGVARRGIDIRFTGADGAVTVGRYVDL